MIAFRTNSDRDRFRLRSAGLNFAPMGVFFLIEAICALVTPGYSYIRHDISFLGYTACFDTGMGLNGSAEQLCPQIYLLLNLALMIAGVAQIAGVATSLTLWPGGWPARVGLGLLAAGAVLLFMVGLFPFNVQPRIHSLSASFNFLMTGLGLVVLGFALGVRSRVGAVTLVLGLMSLVGLVFYTIGAGQLRGLVERIAAYPQIVWYSFAGISMLRAARRGS
jgi:hypothetical membrane protein